VHRSYQGGNEHLVLRAITYKFHVGVRIKEEGREKSWAIINIAGRRVE